MYQIETAKMFLQTISTAVNERKTQQNPKKPKQTMLSKTEQGEAKASKPQQKLAFASKSPHLQPDANQQFTAQRRALSALCYPTSTSNQPQTNTVSNKQATHSFPHGGELYRLSLPRV